MIEPTREELALLDVIASTESPGYNVMYGFDTFDDYSDHPRKYHEITSGPNKGKRSSAAGRYQFLASTWDSVAKRVGLPDFRPEHQDVGATYLARSDYKRKTGRDLTADLASGDPAIIANVGNVLSTTWTSLPSGIEQGQGADAFVSRFNQALGNPGSALGGADPATYAGGTAKGAARIAGLSSAEALAELQRRLASGELSEDEANQMASRLLSDPGAVGGTGDGGATSAREPVRKLEPNYVQLSRGQRTRWG